MIENTDERDVDFDGLVRWLNDNGFRKAPEGYTRTVALPNGGTNALTFILRSCVTLPPYMEHVMVNTIISNGGDE